MRDKFAHNNGLSLRIGINTGPVVAGVIGRIQVTRAIYERVGGQYPCERRGLIDIKGEGKMETYFLLEPS